MSRPLPLQRWKALGYTPNKWAVENVHSRSETFINGVTARQVGKTVAGALEIDAELHREPDEFGVPVVGLNAPTYQKCDLMLDKLQEYWSNAYGHDYWTINKNDHVIRIPSTGARLHWLSGEQPLSSVGFTFSLLINDESQGIADTVMDKVQPATDVREARWISFGTPDITPDQTWFKAAYLRGLDTSWPDEHAFRVTAFENPWMSLDRLLAVLRRRTDRQFRMLYMAEWVDEEGGVFRQWDRALLAEAAPYNRHQHYVMSVDFGIHDDFTVVMLGETASRQAIGMWRWNETDPMQTYDRILDLWEQHGRPRVITDSTGGMGIAMTAELQARGLRCTPITISPANKMKMITELAADIEHRRMMFPAWDTLVRELKGFVYHKTPSGKLTASAASGFHDDCIDSLMLLNQGFRQKGAGSGRRRQDNYLGTNNRRGVAGRQLTRPIPHAIERAVDEELVRA